ncbi:hypothetical protein ACT7C4_12590 [Bacillus pacificus]
MKFPIWKVQLKKGEATTIPAAKLSKEELEAQLEGFWSKGTVYEGQQEVAAVVQEPTLSSAEHKKDSIIFRY